MSGMYGMEACQKMNEAGIKTPDNVSRVVIDIPCDGTVKVYYECLVNQTDMDIINDILVAGKDIPLKEAE